MAVSRIATPHAYVGLSSDEKPTDDEENNIVIPPGSTFVERDTGLEFIWDGAEWGQRIYPTELPG